jgi:protoheme IX farnesyltransferase
VLVSAGVGFVFLWAVATQFRTGTDLAAYRSFHASNAYLGALLGAILIETLVV